MRHRPSASDTPPRSAGRRPRTSTKQRQAATGWPIFYFLCHLRYRYPSTLKTARVVSATGYSAVALRHYLRGRVAAPCRYVPIGLAMLGLLRTSGVVSEAEYLVLLRRLKDLAFDAVVESFPLPKSQEMKCPTDKNEKNVHLLPRDEHFHGTKVARIYESSKYSGKKVSKKVCINSVYLRFA